MSRVARCQGVNIDVAKGGAVSVGILFFSIVLYIFIHALGYLSIGILSIGILYINWTRRSDSGLVNIDVAKGC